MLKTDRPGARVIIGINIQPITSNKPSNQPRLGPSILALDEVVILKGGN